MTQSYRYSLKKKYFSAFWRNIFFALNRLLVALSLKNSRQYWGIVYDSVNKQPLDPAIVKLLYVDGREVETCVTDMAGRYGFLARPGKFKIFAKKSNYLFPSQFAPNDSDGIYDNLYHGEFFELRDGAEVIAPNIPMDPLARDWNQQAKQEIVKSRPYLNKIIKSFVAILFWLGLLLTSIFFTQVYKSAPYSMYALLATYIILIGCGLLAPETRLWGRLVLPADFVEEGEIFLELHNIKFPQISFGKAKVDENGKFLLRANAGHYLLTAFLTEKNKPPIELAKIKIRVGILGVYNGSLMLKR